MKLTSLAKELGVEIKTNSNVKEIIVENGKATGVKTENETILSDLVLSGADYNHLKSYYLSKQWGIVTTIGIKKHSHRHHYYFTLGLIKSLII